MLPSEHRTECPASATAQRSDRSRSLRSGSLGVLIRVTDSADSAVPLGGVAGVRVGPGPGAVLGCGVRHRLRRAGLRLACECVLRAGLVPQATWAPPLSRSAPLSIPPAPEQLTGGPWALPTRRRNVNKSTSGLILESSLGPGGTRRGGWGWGGRSIPKCQVVQICPHHGCTDSRGSEKAMERAGAGCVGGGGVALCTPCSPGEEPSTQGL